MREDHSREQYFFDAKTTLALARFLRGYETPCCLCTPMVARELASVGRISTLLDTDERFVDVPGFRRFDLYRPEFLAQRFDVIFADPPFFNVSLSQLFRAVRQLAHHDLGQPLLIAYLTRRESALLGTFHPFGLRPTGIELGYLTVQTGEKTRIELYSNLPEREVNRLGSAFAERE